LFEFFKGSLHYIAGSKIITEEKLVRFLERNTNINALNKV